MNFLSIGLIKITSVYAWYQFLIFVFFHKWEMKSKLLECSTLEFPVFE